MWTTLFNILCILLALIGGPWVYFMVKAHMEIDEHVYKDLGEEVTPYQDLDLEFPESD